MDNSSNMIPEMFRLAYEIQVDNIAKWIEFVAYVNWGKQKIKCGECIMPTWVYRGQADASWSLKSGFERTVSIDNSTEGKLRFIERQSINQYRSFSPLVKGLSDAELLAYMQHYGVKTRLLDFSYLPLVALYFAVQDEKIDKCSEDGDFAVWMVSLNASGGIYDREMLFNAVANHVKNCNGKRSVVSQQIHCEGLDSTSFNNYRRMCVDQELLLNILNEKDGSSSLKEAPMLAYDVINKNERLQAQDGLFLAQTELSKTFMDSFYEWQQLKQNEFVKVKVPISRLFNGEKLGDDMIAAGVAFKFVFPAELREKAKAYLNVANVRPSVLFPDPEGVAKEVNLRIMTTK